MAIPLDRRNLSEQIAEDLRRQILSGVLAAGDRLPPERDLAQQYGTNRNTLREAIRQLDGLGLVSVRQGAGVRVRDWRHDGELALLQPFILEAASSSERAQTILDLLRTRRVLLSEAAAMAAEKATAADIASLQEHADGLSNSSLPLDAMERDLAFYGALVEATHSLVVRWAYNTFSRVYESGQRLIVDLWVTPAGHAAALATVVSLIREHRPEPAKRTLEQHLAKSDTLVAPLLQNPVFGPFKGGIQ